MIATTTKKLKLHFSRREAKKFPAKLCKEGFKPFGVGLHGLLVRVVSVSVIYCPMCSSESLHVLYILPFGMWCMSACKLMLMRMLLAVRGLVGVVVSEKAASVYCFQFTFL